MTSDTGYESLDNYLYPEANGQARFNKPSSYDAQKTVLQESVHRENNAAGSSDFEIDLPGEAAAIAGEQHQFYRRFA